MRSVNIQEYEAERAAAKRSSLEAKMALILRTMAQGWPEMPAWEVEYKFSPDRRWRFDFAAVEARVAIECNGGTWQNGRHNNAVSIGKDYEKINEAQVLGWTVLQFTADQINNTRYVEKVVRRALEARPHG